MSLTVFATLDGTPEELDQLRAAVLDLAEASRAEQGCLSYDIWQTENPPRLVFHEVWVDAAGLEAHRRAPHLDAFRQALRATKARVWASAATRF